jgi:membrane protein DedA with SNARE-associated domain
MMMLEASAALPIIDRLWWYASLAATGIVTEEATPLIGGLAAHDGHILLVEAGIAVTVGIWVAGLLLYWIGRWRGAWVRKRFPGTRRVMLRALTIVRRHPWRSSLAVRFAYGLRLVLPMACGAARVPIVLYLIATAISSAVWGFLFTVLGWAFGEGILLVLNHVKRYEWYLVVAILIAVGIGFWFARRRHLEERSLEVLATGDEDRPVSGTREASGTRA